MIFGMILSDAENFIMNAGKISVTPKVFQSSSSEQRFAICFRKNSRIMPKVTRKKSKRNTTPTIDHSEVVAAVKRQHDEFKKEEACDLLQGNLNRRKSLIEKSLFEYDSAVWEPESSAICEITRAHNQVWAVNPAIYRDAYMLQRIRFDPTVKYTLYDMGSDGKCRRVSIDGEVCQIEILFVSSKLLV